MRARLRDIIAPTLIVHGTEDQLARWSGAVLMSEQIPNAELRSIAGGRHAIVVQYADTPSENTEVRARLRDIIAPTLIVHGTEDQLARWSGAVLMSEQIPNAELRSIAGGRHAIVVQYADTIASWVPEFLAVTAA